MSVSNSGTSFDLISLRRTQVLVILSWGKYIDLDGEHKKQFVDQLSEDISIKLSEICVRASNLNPKTKPHLNTIFYSILDTLIDLINEFGESSKQNENAITAAIWLINELLTHSPKVKNIIIDNLVVIDALVDVLAGLIEINKNEDILIKTAQISIKIDPNNQKALDTILHIVESTEDENILLQASENLAKIAPGNETALKALGHLIEITKDEDILLSASESLREILQSDQFPKVVTALKRYMTERVDKDNFELCETFNDILWRYAQSMTYPAFYHAWHGESSQVQALENQFTDIASQMQPTDKTYPIIINAQALEGETDTSAIAQELCNQIYLTAFPDELEIPEVGNAPQLKRLIPQLKKQLQKPNLAVILDKCEPNQEQVAFCRKLTDVVHIAWITNQPLEAPLKGFLPEQANLLSAIQSWIDDIG